jgi:hypothetical protein
MRIYGNLYLKRTIGVMPIGIAGARYDSCEPTGIADAAAKIYAKIKNDQAIIEKQAELIKHYKNKPIVVGISRTTEWDVWLDAKYQLNDELVALQSGKAEVKEVTDEVKEAIEFIAENPYQDDYVNRNFHNFLNHSGDVDDNSIEVANEWHGYYITVIKWLTEQAKSQPTLDKTK